MIGTLTFSPSFLRAVGKLICERLTPTRHLIFLKLIEYASIVTFLYLEAYFYLQNQEIKIENLRIYRD